MNIYNKRDFSEACFGAIQQYDESVNNHIKKSHNVSYLLYHLVCPAKYRRFVFEQIKGVDQLIVKTCQEIEKRYEIHFVEIGVDKNHVHFLIQSVPMISPTTFVRTVKSITARQTLSQVPEVKDLLWGGEFWTKGYYINTVGKSGNENVIREYVKNQGLQYQQKYRSQLKLLEGF